MGLPCPWGYPQVVLPLHSQSLHQLFHPDAWGSQQSPPSKKHSLRHEPTVQLLPSYQPYSTWGGDQNDPPRLIIVQQSSWNALNRLIFHDFVPCNIRKFLGSPFLEFLFEISKKFYVDNFFHIQSKGGTLLYV